jgi:hypothetical protein
LALKSNSGKNSNIRIDIKKRAFVSIQIACCCVVHLKQTSTRTIPVKCYFPDTRSKSNFVRTKSRIRSLFNIRKVKKNPSTSPGTSPVGGASNNFCSRRPTKSPGAPGRFGARQARGRWEPRWEEALHVSGGGWWLCRLETTTAVGTTGASSTRGGRDDGSELLLPVAVDLAQGNGGGAASNRPSRRRRGTAAAQVKP